MKAAFRSRGAQLLRARVALVGLAAVSGLSVAGSAVGFVFQMILAARFGTVAAIDAYLFAISVPTFLASLGAAALSFAVVPALVLVEQDPAARSTLLKKMRRRAGVVALGFIAFGVPAMTLQQHLLPASLGRHSVPALPMMILLGWAIGGVQFFSTLYTVELNAARRPIIAALLALLPNLGAITVVLMAPRIIIVAPIGVLVGSLAVVGTGTFLTRRSFHGAAGAVVTTDVRAKSVGWTLLAMSCFSSYVLIDAFWAPRAGSGTLASLGYAQRLVIGIGGLVLAGPSAILTPRFAARLRDHGSGPFLRDVLRAVAVVGLLAVAAALLLALLSDRIIGFAFGRGAFHAGDIARVSSVFRSMLPGFCGMMVSVILNRGIYCLPAIEGPMAMLGLGWSLLYFCMCGLLLSHGGVGFGISYSVAWFGYTLIAASILRHAARRAIPAAGE